MRTLEGQLQQSKTPAPKDDSSSTSQQSKMLNPNLLSLSEKQRLEEVKKVKKHFAPVHQRKKPGEVVIIEKNEEAIQKLFKLKGYKLQFDDRVSAFLSANMTSDELVETRNLNDLAQLMQVNKKIVNNLTVRD